MSKHAFAKKDRCSLTFLALVLRGKKRPSPERAQRWSRRTGLPLEAFLFPRSYLRWTNSNKKVQSQANTGSVGSQRK